MQINQLNEISATQELLAGQEATPHSESVEKENGFQSTLQQMVQDIDQLQKQLDQSIQQLTIPEQVNIDQKIQTADSTYDLMMGVKLRLINAYQAITP